MSSPQLPSPPANPPHFAADGKPLCPFSKEGLKGGVLPGCEGLAGATLEAIEQTVQRELAEAQQRIMAEVARLLGGKPGSRADVVNGKIAGDLTSETLSRIERRLEEVVTGNYELRQENEELKRLQAEGFFKFALRVDGEDFRTFAVIMALGTRNAAAEFLRVPLRRLYDRVDRWRNLGRDQQRMFRLMEWRKRSGRRIKVRLDESLQSSESGGQPENPETLKTAVEQLKDDAVDRRDYPEILGQILEALQRQNAANWSSVRQELVEILREEVPQENSQTF